MRSWIAFIQGVAVLGAALFVSGNAAADEFTIGRTKAIFAEPGWQEVGGADADMAFSGEISGTTRAVAKWLALTDGGANVLAIVSIRSTVAGAGSGGIGMRFQAGCKRAERDNYVHDATGGSFDKLDCTRAQENINSQTTIRRIAPKIFETLEQKKLKLPRNALNAIYSTGISSGSFVAVNLFLDQRFVGDLGAAPLDGKSTTGNQAFARWIDGVARAGRKSVLSTDGVMSFPAFQFAIEKQ